MKWYATAVLCFLFGRIGFAQKDNDRLHLYRYDGKRPASIEEADYFRQDTKENDTLYIRRYYRRNGPMLRWESYSDEDHKRPNGWFGWYNEQGLLDSAGWVSNGKKDRDWLYGHSWSGHAAYSERYENKRLTERRDFIKKTITYRNGEVKALEDEQAANDPSGEKDPATTEAMFKGSVSKWVTYLSRNLNTPQRAQNLYPNGANLTVVVDFYVNTKGKLENITINRSVEWSVDTEAMRVLRSSPDWKPATRNGREVVYHHRQSITFSIRK